MKESNNKEKAKRTPYKMLSLISLGCLAMWLFACLFACGQLYDTYDLWEYISDAPIAVAIIIGLLASFIGFLAAAICVKAEGE
jgi:hypothetical protein